MPLLEAFGRYATMAAGIVLVALLTAGRTVAKNPSFKRDLRSAQFYLAGFVLAELIRKVIPDAWTNADRYAKLAGLVLFSLGAIRSVAGGWFHLHRSRTGHEIPKILRDLVDAGLLIIALLVILQATVDVNLSALLASSAVISLVVGLALQETLGNVFAGLSLQAERPFGVGDWVRIGEHTGRIAEIGWRATKLLTRMGETVTVPNNSVAKEAIYNFSRHGSLLRTLAVGIDYDVAPNMFKEIALDLMAANPRIISDPAPGVRVASFGSSAMEYVLAFWVARFEDGLSTEDEVRSQLWYRLRRAGMGIPFPITTVHMAKVQEKSTQVGGLDISQLLARVDFLAGISEPLRAELAQRASIVHFGQNEVIIRQGDTSPGAFYVIGEGEVSIRAGNPGGPEEEVARLEPGNFFGEMAVLTGEPRSASVIATRDTVLVAVDRGAFAGLFHRDPNVAQVLTEVLANRRKGLTKVIESAQNQHSSNREPRQLLERLRQVFRNL